MDKVLLINNKSEAKSFLIKSLETAGFEVTGIEDGLIHVNFQQDKLSTAKEAQNLNNLHSIFPSIPRLSQVFEFIELNYYHNIKLKEVAQAVGYSSAYLTDLVRRMTGKTVNDWIIERRITEAKRLLLETEDSIEKIALKVGYQNINHFYCQFRNYCRNTPGSWRKEQYFSCLQSNN